MTNIETNRSSRSEVFYKEGALKNFVKFTGKHLCWSLISAKLQALNFLVSFVTFKIFFYRKPPMASSKSMEAKSFCFSNLNFKNC